MAKIIENTIRIHSFSNISKLEEKKETNKNGYSSIFTPNKKLSNVLYQIKKLNENSEEQIYYKFMTVTERMENLLTQYDNKDRITIDFHKTFSFPKFFL